MTTDTVGGVWTYALELARGLSAIADVEIALAAMGGPLSREARAEAAAIPRVSLYESTYALEWMPEPWAEVDASCRWLEGLARELAPHVVHANTYSHGAISLAAPVLVVGHSCVLSWWAAVRRTPLPAEWFEYRRRVMAGLLGATLVVAPSEAMASALCRHYGPLPPTRVIYNGRTRADTSVSKEPLIFAAGRLWDEAKNIMALDAVAAGVTWPIHVAGDCQLGDARVSPRHLQVMGRLDPVEVQRWQARAAIYALPVRYEPFGLSILEAAAAGCALVLGDVESLREIWGDAAVYVAPDDHEGLRGALTRLIDDGDHRARLATLARRCAAPLSRERMARSYLRLYHELTEAAGLRRVQG
jgi:glycogen synthase